MRLHGALPPPAVIPAQIIQPFIDRVAAASGGALAIQKFDAMALGATPVGMPVPAVPEALSKGVVDGTVIPWEITRPLRLSELVGHHTELAGPEALYTATFIMAMSHASGQSSASS